MANKKIKTKRTRFKELAYQEAKKNLQNAIEWINKKDCIWAIVCVDQAQRLLQVVRYEN